MQGWLRFDAFGCLRLVLIIPALDLRAGRVVRLLRGDFAQERRYGADAVGRAREYASAGAGRLHVVDLDAARGSGDNRALVERIITETGLAVQVAGGVRTEQDVDRWLGCGAAAVVMGTTAAREPQRLAEVAAGRPGRVLGALDVRDGRPAVAGWLDTEDVTVAAILAEWSRADLAGVIVTSIERDGTQAGPDLDLLSQVLVASRHPVIYSGGIRSLEDVADVAAAGAAGVILGKSLLEGTISLAEALAW